MFFHIFSSCFEWNASLVTTIVWFLDNFRCWYFSDSANWTIKKISEYLIVHNIQQSNLFEVQTLLKMIHFQNYWGSEGSQYVKRISGAQIWILNIKILSARFKVRDCMRKMRFDVRDCKRNVWFEARSGVNLVAVTQPNVSGLVQWLQLCQAASQGTGLAA